MESEGQNAQVPPASPPRAVDRSFDVLCHLLGLAGLTGIPFANVLGPLILWLLKRAESPSVDEHGKEALNFQISMTIWVLLCIPLIFILVGVFAIIALVILDVVFVIIAALRASEGILYRYPMTIRFIK